MRGGTPAGVRAFSLNAGSGALTFGGTVNTGANITATAATINMSGAWGGTTPVGNVTLNSTNSLSLPAITTAAGKTVDVTVTGAGNSITTTGAIATGAAGNITLTADDLVVGGNLSGTGTITLRPNSASRIVRLNFGSGDFNLSTAEIANLSNGWNLINIGRTDSTAVQNIGTSSWIDNVNFRTAFNHSIYGTITTTDNATQTFQSASSGTNFMGGGINSDGAVLINGYIWMNAATNIITTNDNVTLGYNVYVGPTLMINTGTATASVIGNVYRSGSAGSNSLDITAGTVSFGGNIGTSSTAIDNLRITSTSGITLPNIYASNILIQTTGITSDITIGSGKILTATGAGDAITLASGRNFINSSGSVNPIILTGSGRWLTYSADPSNDTLGGLSSNFIRYGCTYGGACPSGVTIPATGNGNIYTYRPTLTITPSAVATTYGDAAPNLNGYSYTVTGYLVGSAGDDSSFDSLTGTLSGTTSYAQGNDIGSYNIDYGSGTLTSAMGYLVNYANNSNAIIVGKRTLTVGLTGTVDRIYNGTNTASILTGNYNISGLYVGDVSTVSILNSGATYDDKNVGAYKTVTVNGLSLTGSKSGNYQLASTSVSAAIGNIAKKLLNIVGLSGVDRVYDGTRVAGISGVGLLSGDVVGDDVIISSVGVGEFADKNVGVIKPITVTGYAISGTDANNYDLVQPTSLTADINKKTLTVTANDRTISYGTATPSTTVVSYSGFIAGEDVTALTVSPIATSMRAGQQNVGTYINNYIVSGGVSDNYDFNYLGGDLIVTGNLSVPSVIPAISELPNTYVYSSQKPVANNASFMQPKLTNVTYQISNDDEVVSDESNVSIDNLYEPKGSQSEFLIIEIAPILAEKLDLEQKDIQSY